MRFAERSLPAGPLRPHGTGTPPPCAVLAAGGSSVPARKRTRVEYRLRGRDEILKAGGGGGGRIVFACP